MELFKAYLGKFKQFNNCYVDKMKWLGLKMQNLVKFNPFWTDLIQSDPK